MMRSLPLPPMSIDEEEPLQRTMPSGSTSALDFHGIYDAYASFVWTNARRLGIPADHIEDVVQDVFMVVHRRLNDFGANSSIKTWLWGILINVVRDRRRRYRRKEQNEEREAIGEVTAHDAQPDERAAAGEALRVVQAVLERLSDEKRELFILSQLEELTASEIAELTKKNVNTVYSRIRVARQDFEREFQRLTRGCGAGEIR